MFFRELIISISFNNISQIFIKIIKKYKLNDIIKLLNLNF